MSALVEVVTALERGGAQRIALELAAELHTDARPTYLLSGGADEALVGEARTRLRERSLRLRHLRNPLSPLGDMTALVELGRALARLRERHGEPLIVHTHSSKAGVLGRLAARAIPGAVVVHTVHGFGFDALGPRFARVLEFAERVAGAGTDGLVFVASADRDAADRMRLAPRAEHVVIPGFCAVNSAGGDDLDTQARRARARRHFRIAQDAPLAVTVANFKAQKDPLFHVDVLAAWRRTSPTAQLLFVGDGPLRSQARKRAEDLNVGEALITPGFVDDPTPAYAAADAFLLASRWEGLPMSSLEALARGLPVVVRDAGWARDLAFTERARALALDAAPEAFARALDDAVASGLSVVELPRRFTLPGMLDAHRQLYAQLARRSA